MFETFNGFEKPDEEIASIRRIINLVHELNALVIRIGADYRHLDDDLKPNHIQMELYRHNYRVENRLSLLWKRYLKEVALELDDDFIQSQLLTTGMEPYTYEPDSLYQTEKASLILNFAVMGLPEIETYTVWHVMLPLVLHLASIETNQTTMAAGFSEGKSRLLVIDIADLLETDPEEAKRLFRECVSRSTLPRFPESLWEEENEYLAGLKIGEQWLKFVIELVKQYEIELEDEDY